MKQEMIVLTLIVPAYNSAATLEKCLHSLFDEQVQDEIEVIIVNDGSTDSTAAIAQAFVNKHPNCRLINKENGGHGSVINVASKLASGKYIKVIDSDDWVQTQNLPSYVKALVNAQADVVLTHFRTHDSRSGVTREYKMQNVDLNKEYLFEALWKQKSNSIKHVCNFHGITYQRQFYNECNLHLSEGISYEDQEYATLPFANIKTILPLDLYLYEYSLGSATQSVSEENQVKKFPDMLQVFWRLMNEPLHEKNKSINDYINFKQGEKLLSCYITGLIINKNKKEGRKQINNLRTKLKVINKKTYNNAQKKYWICLVASYLGFNGTHLRRIKESPLCKRMAAWVRK